MKSKSHLCIFRTALNKNLAIIGPGADIVTVSGNNASRVFNIGNFNVNLSGLSISNGLAATEGGGINNIGSLTVSSCHLVNNQANSGGGVNNLGGALVMESSALCNNRATLEGGGLANSGNSFAALTNCTISGNSGGSGIFNAANNGQTARLALTHCTVTNNFGAFALKNVNTGGGSVSTLNNTLAAGNSGANFGTINANNSFVSLGYNRQRRHQRLC